MAGRTLTVVAVVCAWCTWVVAQEPSKLPPTHRVGGARDGASAFRRVDYPQLKAKTPGEIDFAHYHTYDETAATAAFLGHKVSGPRRALFRRTVVRGP